MSEREYPPGWQPSAAAVDEFGRTPDPKTADELRERGGFLDYAKRKNRGGNGPPGR